MKAAQQQDAAHCLNVKLDAGSNPDRALPFRVHSQMVCARYALQRAS